MTATGNLRKSRWFKYSMDCAASIGHGRSRPQTGTASARVADPRARSGACRNAAGDGSGIEFCERRPAPDRIASPLTEFIAGGLSFYF